ncbi:hypothetical protein [uncultured Gammaproteobacteria bacterium]|nr:hypothetical protein [uncultured Gammaproteobacteria bacterium]
MVFKIFGLIYHHIGGLESLNGKASELLTIYHHIGGLEI